MVSRTLTTLALALAVGQANLFDVSRWTIVDPGGKAMSYLGAPSIFLDNGIALLRDSSFADGTIEFDVALHGHASFAGVAFRAASADDYELIYVRAHRSRQWDALQYTPIFSGSEAWQLYSGEGYTAPAELPANRWLHVRVAVEGRTARVFVDRAPEPQLVVTDLKRPWAAGQVGLWGRLGGANFTNVVVTPARATAPAPAPDAPAARGVIDRWELSQVFDEAKASSRRLPDPSRVTWMPVVTEPSGLLNIARYRAPVVAREAAPARDSRDVVFARAVVTATESKRVRLVFGYSDAVRIFHNGRLLFEAESRFRSRDPGFLGVISLGPDAIYLDLRPGRNELVFAVSETFGGWGLAARMESE
jgi:hypothetical protein